MTREAVVVVPENAAAGKVNGKQLAATAPLHGQPRALSGAKTPAPQEPGAAPGPASPPRAAGDTGVAVAPGAASAEGVVVRAEARHNDPRGLHKTADEFMQVCRGVAGPCICVWAHEFFLRKTTFGASPLSLWGS